MIMKWVSIFTQGQNRKHAQEDLQRTESVEDLVFRQYGERSNMNHVDLLRKKIVLILYLH